MNTRSLYMNRQCRTDERVEDLLSRMTIGEKLGQLSQAFPGLLENPGDVLTMIAKGEIGSFIWGQTDLALRNRYQKAAVEESRLGIPLIFGMDIIHGARTIFPSAIGLSCSFEPSLFERAQSVAAREARAEGIEWAFAPMCDLARDPRWGRVVETCGEDPYLSALCNAAQVRGFQGDNPSAPGKVAACLKHYVGYSAVTGGRDYNDAEVTEWTLRNAHLPSFHAGVQAGAMTIMSSFNTMQGIPSAANHHNLTDILRDEWRFQGFVVSDWNAVEETKRWGYAADDADAARLCICAGNDMEMISRSYANSLAAQVADGRVPAEVVDEAVRRVLRIKFRVGLFENPFVTETDYDIAILRPDAIALARECVVKATVLLKNSGILPLTASARRIAVIGPFADDPSEMLGCWSARGMAGDVVTLAEGIKLKLAGNAEITVVKGCEIIPQPRTRTLQDGSVVPDDTGLQSDAVASTLADAVQAARGADVVIIALGEPRGWTGEHRSRAHLDLPEEQQQLFEAVAATGKPVVAIIFSGRPLVLPEILEHSAALLYAWQPGIQAGNGLADLLTGDAAPSARLSMSVLRDARQSPLFYNHPRTGRPGDAKYLDLPRNDAQFWFGFGLTYTTFEYGKVEIQPASGGKPAEAIIAVRNTGTRDGTELVQLYIRQLACHAGIRPEQELRGFAHTFVPRGQTVEIRFPLTDETLGFVNRGGKWQIDEGVYQVWIAPCAFSGEPATYVHRRSGAIHD